MAYIGKVPTAVPLTTSDLADGIVTVSKLATTLDLSGNTITLPSGVGGKVLQVLSTTKTDAFVSTSSSAVDVTGLSVNITPSSTSSKIFINVSLAVSNNNSVNPTRGRIIRVISAIETELDNGDSAGSRDSASFDIYQGNGNHQEKISLSYLDSPSTTSECTYKINLNNDGTSGEILVNRALTDSSNTFSQTRTSSTITVMEIAG